MGGSSRSSSAFARCSGTAPSSSLICDISRHSTTRASSTADDRQEKVISKVGTRKLEPAGRINGRIVGFGIRSRPRTGNRETRSTTCAGRRGGLSRAESGSKGSGVEPGSVGPLAGAATMSARGSPPDASRSRHQGDADASRGSHHHAPMVQTSAPHRAESPIGVKTRTREGVVLMKDHESRHAR